MTDINAGRISWLKQHPGMLLVVLLAIGLIALRAALPTMLERYVNRQLQQLDNYAGRVERIHVALWRGAYAIENIAIEKKGATNNETFFISDRLAIELQWRALWHGSLVGRARFEQAQLNLVESENPEQRQLGDGNNWNAALAKLFPFTFNEITCVNCTVRFRAPGIERREALVVRDVRFSLRNLTNAFPAEDSAAFADFDLEGRVLGQGSLRIDGKLNPAATSPTFEVAAQLQDVALPELNPWLDTYAGVNARAGNFSVYTEFAAADGKFKGYVKPIARDIDIVTPPDERKNLFRRAWAGLVELAATIFKNHPHDQLATRIPFSGTIDDPSADVWVTLINVLRNAFVNAFSNSLEHSVDLHSISDDESD